MDIERFIYNTIKPGTNSLKSTTFWVVGIGKIKTKKKVAEAMRLKMPVMKKCMVMQETYRVNYDTLTWDKITDTKN